MIDLTQYLATGLLDAYTTIDPIMRDAKIAMYNSVLDQLNGKENTDNESSTDFFKPNR